MQNDKDGKNIDCSVVYKLADLAGYQEGSVVSRTLIHKEAGTVTIFSFDKGQGLSEHSAPYDALVNVVDGKAEITISGVRYNLIEGESIVMPAGEPHSLRALEQFKMVLVMIKE